MKQRPFFSASRTAHVRVHYVCQVITRSHVRLRYEVHAIYVYALRTVTGMFLDAKIGNAGSLYCVKCKVPRTFRWKNFRIFRIFAKYVSAFFFQIIHA